MADMLDNTQRRFIVERLAAFNTPTRVAAELLEQFGVTVMPCVVAAYDPTTLAGKRCSAHWRRRFEAARAAHVHGPAPPIASRKVRLHERQRMYASALQREDLLLANRILDSIAREIGDDTSGLAKQAEITDEQRAQALAVFVRRQRWKADALRPLTAEEAAAWDRDPVRQFMAMLGPPPKKAAGRKASQPQ